MDIFMYGMFLLPLAVFVPIYVAEKVGAPNWYLILTGMMFGFVLTSVWRWVNDVPVEYISIPELWAVNVLVSQAALALFYIVKSLRPREVYALPPQVGYYTSTNYEMNTEKELFDDEETPERNQEMSEIKRYRKKPVVIEAVQWDGTSGGADTVIDWISDNEGCARYHCAPGGCTGTEEGHRVAIETLEGTMSADAGDFIIRGVQGEFYPCKPEIFEKTYEAVGQL